MAFILVQDGAELAELNSPLNLSLFIDIYFGTGRYRICWTKFTSKSLPFYGRLFSFRTVQNLLNDPNIMQQIQQMSATIQKNEELKSELTLHEERQKMLQQQQEEFDKQIQLQQPPPPTASAARHHHPHHHMPPIPMDMSIPPPQGNMPPTDAMMHQHHQYQVGHMTR